MKKLLAEVAALVAVAAVITGVLRSMPTFDHLRTATLAQHWVTESPPVSYREQDSDESADASDGVSETTWAKVSSTSAHGANVSW